MKSDQKPVPTYSPVAPSESSTLMEHWRLLKCHLFWAYDRPLTRVPRRWEYAPYPSAAWLLRKGWAVIEYSDGVKERYEAGNWVLPRSAQGVQEFSEDAHVLSIRFLFEWPNGEPLFPRARSIILPEKEQPAFTLASEKLVEFVTARFPMRSGAQSFLHGTLREYLHLQPVFSAWSAAYYDMLHDHGLSATSLHHLHEKVRQAIAHLDERSLSTGFHENDLADEVGLSSSYLHKVFLKEIGMTPMAYWNDRKLAATKSRLVGSTQSIKAIAYEMGFSSPENFTHWFRTRTGQSPSQFREAHQGTRLL